jgi:hypothetical protein
MQMLELEATAEKDFTVYCTAHPLILLDVLLLPTVGWYNACALLYTPKYSRCGPIFQTPVTTRL